MIRKKGKLFMCLKEKKGINHLGKLTLTNNSDMIITDEAVGKANSFEGNVLIVVGVSI